MSGSSFSFRAVAGGVEWGFTDQDMPLRTLREVKLYDVGPVTFPAYLDTEADMKRSIAHREISEACGVSLDEVTAATELRSLFRREEGDAPELHSTPPSLIPVRVARAVVASTDEVDARYAAWERTAGR